MKEFIWRRQNNHSQLKSRLVLYREIRSADHNIYIKSYTGRLAQLITIYQVLHGEISSTDYNIMLGHPERLTQLITICQVLHGKISSTDHNM